MFIATVFTIAKTCKQPKCPSAEEWIKKMWYLHLMEYYSAMKKNEIMPFAATRMDLQLIIQSEVSQTKKFHKISHMWNLEKDTNELIYKTETVRFVLLLYYHLLYTCAFYNA